MSTQQKQQAVATAGDRLEAIEAWCRRSFITLVVIAHMTAALAAAALYAGYEYYSLKSAVTEAQAKAAKNLEDFRAHRPGRP